MNSTNYTINFWLNGCLSIVKLLDWLIDWLFDCEWMSGWMNDCFDWFGLIDYYLWKQLIDLLIDSIVYYFCLDCNSYLNLIKNLLIWVVVVVFGFLLGNFNIYLLDFVEINIYFVGCFYVPD